MQERKRVRRTQRWHSARKLYLRHLLRTVKSMCERRLLSIVNGSVASAIVDAPSSGLVAGRLSCSATTAHRSRSIYRHYGAPVLGSTDFMSLGGADFMPEVSQDDGSRREVAKARDGAERLD